MFRDAKKINRISKIVLTKSREEQILSSFNDTPVDFNYLQYVTEFNSLIESFQNQEKNDVENFDENNILGKKK